MIAVDLSRVFAQRNTAIMEWAVYRPSQKRPVSRPPTSHKPRSRPDNQGRTYGPTLATRLQQFATMSEWHRNRGRT
jgi:hypothetical protein